MTSTCGPPTRYRTVSGRHGDTGRHRVWHWPEMRMQDGRWWLEHTVTDHWVPLGYGPRPRTRREALRVHFGHGLMMGYPLAAVVVWCARHLLRDPWKEYSP